MERKLSAIKYIHRNVPRMKRDYAGLLRAHHVNHCWRNKMPLIPLLWHFKGKNCTRRMASAFRYFSLIFSALLICFITLITGSAHANDCASGFSPQFQHLSLEQGLSQSVVTAIQEDQDGYVWFGTQEGLNRYDGSGFVIWARHQTFAKQLPDNHITALAADANGVLWIGTINGLAFKKKNQDLVLTPKLPQSVARDYILSLLIDRSGRVWVGTTKGLYVYDPVKETTVIWIGEGGRDVPDSHARTLMLDSDNGLWVGTANGAYRINVAAEKWEEQKYLAGINVSDLLETRDKRILAGSHRSVYVRELNHPERFEEAPYSIPGTETQSLSEDKDGRIWVATNNGVVVIQGTEQCTLVRNTMNISTLSNNDVMSLYADKNGIIWLGSYAGGVSFWDTASARFQHHIIPSRMDDTLRTNTVLAITRDNQHSLWLGLANEGLVRKTGRKLEKISLSSIGLNNPAITVQALLKDKYGHLWIGTYGDGLIKRTGDGKETRFFPDAQSISSISSKYIRALYEDHAGRLWIGTEAGLDQVVEHPDGEISFNRYGDQLPVAYLSLSSEVNAIVEDYLGQLWVGGPGGLIMMKDDNSNMVHFQHDPKVPDSLSHSTVTALSLGSNGDIWIGTQEGFNRAKRGSDGQYKFIRDNKIINSDSTVFGMLPGINDDIWISTSNGLVRYNPNKAYAVRYRRAQGLPSDEFNFGASFLGNDGELIFGTINGAVSFYPGAMPMVRNDVSVALVDYREFDQSVPLVQNADGSYSHSIDAQTHVLSFDYAVLDFSDPTRNRLRYRLRGLHENWINLVRSRTVTLSGLEPGRYALEVQGASSIGVWSDKLHKVEITVRSPFWSLHAIYSAIMLAMSLLFMLIIVILYRRLKSTEKTHLDDDALLQRRFKELAEANVHFERIYNQHVEQIDRQEKQVIHLQKKLLDAQHHDPLTNIFSRRYVLPLLSEFRLTTTPTVIVLVDIDSLGYLNEQYGLEAGDRILTQFAHLLQSICRVDDHVLRWDGGTFMLVGKISSLNEVRGLCERIKSSVLQHAFMLSERKHADVTCSIGFATWPLCLDGVKSNNWQESVHVAEEALGLAKHYGRNCWFGFYKPENDLESPGKLMERRAIIEAVQSGVLKVESSIVVGQQIIGAWPKR